MSAALTLADFTCPTLIEPALRGHDQAAVLMELTRRLHNAGAVGDLMQFYHAAFNREFLESTSVGGDLALPHVRLPGLARLVFALGRSSAPIQWTGAPRPSVRWVILAAVPASNLGDYLALLAALARVVQLRDFRHELGAAFGAEEILALLRNVPLKNAPAVPHAAVA
jgi:mannitol/fructose-specific phosphotransferase system IIA component (Ntr-type)